ncbi:hypothetical protein CVT25_002084 [Psilocybe cyanescens]|uniref:Uncharacterized protein n=1 Tax=Psilocybe cyanescens TaxID=93625 RepID=A0A409X958_PSICY|nr:hypothetical protein CVT25_002084 [Psilocybe cyanescens]
MTLTYVNASCHCGLNAFRVAFETTSLPVVDDLCHCTTCRHVSGQMGVHQTTIVGPPLARDTRRSGSRSHSASRSTSRSRQGSDEGLLHHHPNGNANANGNGDTAKNTKATLLTPPTIEITDAPEVPYDLSELTKYETYSPDVTRYFCSSCSALLFWVPHRPSEEDHWTVSTGALERTDGVVKLGYHIWIGDTLDGGLADHLRTVDGVQLTWFKGEPGSEELPVGWNAVEKRVTSNTIDAKEELLHAHCHCGMIKFAITRPTEASLLPSAPYPDLLYPHNTSHLSKISNLHDEKWWLRPANLSTPTKYLAGHCMCNTCRLTSGFEIQSWAFVPLVNIVTPDTGEPLRLAKEGSRPAGLKQYITSTGKYRESCRTCGATVFSWQIDNADLVSVSVALLDDKKSGVRAENWLEWQRNRVSFKEKAVSQSIAKGLEETMRAI